MIFNQHVTYCNGNDNGNRNILVPCNNAKVGEGALNGKGVARERGEEHEARGITNKSKRQPVGFRFWGGRGGVVGPDPRFQKNPFPLLKKSTHRRRYQTENNDPHFFGMDKWAANLKHTTQLATRSHMHVRVQHALQQ